MPHRAFQPLRRLPAMPASSKSGNENERRCSKLNVIVAAIMVAVGAIFLLSVHMDLNNRPELIAATPNQKNPIVVETAPTLNTPTIVETEVTVLSKPNDWVDLVLKPLIAEVGGLMLFQAIGMPILSDFLWVARRLQWTSLIRGARRLQWLPFAKKIRLWTPVVMRTSKPSRFVRAIPKAIRNLPKSALKLYRRRSRWAVASEYTNFIGNEEEEQ